MMDKRYRMMLALAATACATPALIAGTTNADLAKRPPNGAKPTTVVAAQTVDHVAKRPPNG